MVTNKRLLEELNWQKKFLKPNFFAQLIVATGISGCITGSFGFGAAAIESASTTLLAFYAGGTFLCFLITIFGMTSFVQLVNNNKE
jgi:tellurite resistance protein TehA-like permease